MTDEMILRFSLCVAGGGGRETWDVSPAQQRVRCSEWVSDTSPVRYKMKINSYCTYTMVIKCRGHPRFQTLPRCGRDIRFSGLLPSVCWWQTNISYAAAKRTNTSDMVDILWMTGMCIKWNVHFSQCAAIRPHVLWCTMVNENAVIRQTFGSAHELKSGRQSECCQA